MSLHPKVKVVVKVVAKAAVMLLVVVLAIVVAPYIREQELAVEVVLAIDIVKKLL